MKLIIIQIYQKLVNSDCWKLQTIWGFTKPWCGLLCKESTISGWKRGGEEWYANGRSWWREISNPQVDKRGHTVHGSKAIDKQTDGQTDNLRDRKNDTKKKRLYCIYNWVSEGQTGSKRNFASKKWEIKIDELKPVILISIRHSIMVYEVAYWYTL